MLSSVGSTCTPSQISEVIPCLASDSAMRAGMPGAARAHVDRVRGEDHRAGLGQVPPHRHAAGGMAGGLDEADAGEELGVAVHRLEVEPLVVALKMGGVERTVQAEGPLLLPGAA